MTGSGRFGRHLVVLAGVLFLLTGITAPGLAQQPASSGGLAEGMQLFSQHDLDGSEAVLAALPADAPDRDRASALRVRALIAWRFRQDWEMAEGLLREALALDAERSASWAGLARLETARHRYDAARGAALEAITVAETREEGMVATARLAWAAVHLAEEAFDRAPRDPLDSQTIERLREAHDRLATAVRDNPGDLGMAGPFLRTSIFLGDGPSLLEAWRSYYLTIVGKSDAGVLEGPRETLDALLPGWTDGAPTDGAPTDVTPVHGARTPDDLGRIVSALARSGMYREAWLAAETPGWTRGLEPAEVEGVDEAGETDGGSDAYAPGLAETLAYARFVHEAAALTDEYYRRLALGEADTGRYRTDLLALAEPLWEVIRWDGTPHRLTQRTLIREIDRRFGAEMRGGSTAGYADLHLGHRAIDERIRVSQYGHEADLRFVALDWMVSNGFQSWAWDYRSQHGGWARRDGITQVRAAYAGGGQQVWRAMTDSVELRRFQEETERETERDWERAAGDPHAYLHGLRNRLRAQGVERLLERLRYEGLEGEALERRFLVAFDEAVFASSIEAHEGRHAIDARLGESLTTADREFRAKLSEVAFAPYPRLAFGGIISSTIGGETPHGQANARVMEGLVAWMEEHAGEIPDLDLSRPLLPQLDHLSDDQLKAAMASMDPLAP
jgi:hypothetical protein